MTDDVWGARASVRELTGAEVPVRRVTLLEDRAQVRREGTVTLGRGSQRLRVTGVAPVVADRTVHAKVPEAQVSGARVDEVRVVRRWLVGKEERPAEAAANAAEAERLAQDVVRRRAAATALENRRSSYEKAADLLVEGVQRELPFSATFEARWKDDLLALEGPVRELDKELEKATEELREAESRVKALALRQADSGRPDHTLSTAIEVDLTADREGPVQLVVEYLVPCALWRPIHRAELTVPAPDAGAGAVRFDLGAAVWQRTGEDWSDVELFFSTARPTQQAEPPVLHDDVLRARKKVEKKTVVAVREQAIATTGEGAGEVGEAGVSGEGELPGVDDGGETRLLPGAARADLPSDGRLRRVPVASFEAAVVLDRIGRPERSPLVHLRSRQDNRGSHPVLAGPVELLSGGAFVGRTQVGFVAPGEKFALDWGGDPRLRVHRRVEEHVESGKLLGKRTISRTVELSLSNLGDGPAALTLEERVPVSEVAAVTVEVSRKETTPAGVPDGDGIVRWGLTLPPNGTEKVTLAYRLVATADVQGL